MSFPSGINKIIEEYCCYPKKYIKELTQKTRTIYEQISELSETRCFDLSYSYIIVYPKITSLVNGNNLRYRLLSIENNRKAMFGIRDENRLWGFIYPNRCFQPY